MNERILAQQCPVCLLYHAVKDGHLGEPLDAENNCGNRQTLPIRWGRKE